MTNRVEGECALVLAIDPAALFDFVADPRNDPLWVHGCRAVELLTDPPVERGARLREKVSAAGIPLEIEWEITAYERPRRVVYASRSGPLAMMIVHELQDAPVGTNFSHRLHAKPPAILYPLRPVLRLMLRREARLNVAGLERALVKRVSIRPQSP